MYGIRFRCIVWVPVPSSLVNAWYKIMWLSDLAEEGLARGWGLTMRRPFPYNPAHPLPPALKEATKLLNWILFLAALLWLNSVVPQGILGIKVKPHPLISCLPTCSSGWKGYSCIPPLPLPPPPPPPPRKKFRPSFHPTCRCMLLVHSSRSILEEWNSSWWVLEGTLHQCSNPITNLILLSKSLIFSYLANLKAFQNHACALFMILMYMLYVVQDRPMKIIVQHKNLALATCTSRVD
jgi:hypothetical protein